MTHMCEFFHSGAQSTTPRAVAEVLLMGWVWKRGRAREKLGLFPQAWLMLCHHNKDHCTRAGHPREEHTLHPQYEYIESQGSLTPFTTVWPMGAQTVKHSNRQYNLICKIIRKEKCITIILIRPNVFRLISCWTCPWELKTFFSSFIAYSVFKSGRWFEPLDIGLSAP